MANYMSDAALNLAANEIVGGTVEIRLHSAAPGNDGTANRIGAIAKNVAESDWTAAANGGVESENDVEFGVLRSNASQTVEAWSGWLGGTVFLGWGDVFTLVNGVRTHPVVVPANQAFTIPAGELSFEFTR